MIPTTWTAGRTFTPKAPTETSLGYTVTCQDCNGDATMVQTTSQLQGVGEGHMVTCDYTRRCPTCDPA